MVSIDTNILVRLLTGDGKEQAAKAKRLFSKEHIYITKTVMLETEWVLRYAYEFNADAVADAFTKLLGQQNITVEDAHHIARATGLLRNGMDFADALHLVCSQNYSFVTFDKKLKAKATDAGLEIVRLL
ncbi:MAG TPA: type II toxin-antitoxin system VapC family toxin [Acidiferrobacteraceae bacterium]|nr:type II toxin-antitoxin system VapC family toxin [Acidiferrobacteraceae bacterium]HEX19266.1 type II toxin-antitoxin system VapC family toxin [Acidiferrobacteraceae bacterium]